MTYNDSLDSQGDREQNFALKLHSAGNKMTHIFYITYTAALSEDCMKDFGMMVQNNLARESQTQTL